MYTHARTHVPRCYFKETGKYYVKAWHSRKSIDQSLAVDVDVNIADNQ